MGLRFHFLLIHPMFVILKRTVALLWQFKIPHYQLIKIYKDWMVGLWLLDKIWLQDSEVFLPYHLLLYTTGGGSQKIHCVHHRPWLIVFRKAWAPVQGWYIGCGLVRLGSTALSQLKETGCKWTIFPDFDYRLIPFLCKQNMFYFFT